MFKIFPKQAVDFSGLSRPAGRVDLYCKNTFEAGEERNTLFSEKIRSDQKNGVRNLHRWNQMSAFQQRKQLLRRHIQDPGLLAAGYRIKKRKLPVLKLQNSFFDGVLCSQLIDLHVCLLADAVGTVRRLILLNCTPGSGQGNDP